MVFAYLYGWRRQGYLRSVRRIRPRIEPLNDRTEFHKIRLLEAPGPPCWRRRFVVDGRQQCTALKLPSRVPLARWVGPQSCQQLARLRQEVVGVPGRHSGQAVGKSAVGHWSSFSEGGSVAVYGLGAKRAGGVGRGVPIGAVVALYARSWGLGGREGRARREAAHSFRLREIPNLGRALRRP